MYQVHACTVGLLRDMIKRRVDNRDFVLNRVFYREEVGWKRISFFEYYAAVDQGR